MVKVNLCLSDIPAESIKVGKNNKQYVEIIISQRKTPGFKGETHTVAVSQTKEEREAKKEKVYCGNGTESVFVKGGY